jgi:hypothetical protein
LDNTYEKLDGKDSDGNGYIDDIHGIVSKDGDYTDRGIYTLYTIANSSPCQAHYFYPDGSTAGVVQNKVKVVVCEDELGECLSYFRKLKESGVNIVAANINYRHNGRDPEPVYDDEGNKVTRFGLAGLYNINEIHPLDVKSIQDTIKAGISVVADGGLDTLGNGTEVNRRNSDLDDLLVVGANVDGTNYGTGVDILTNAFQNWSKFQGAHFHNAITTGVIGYLHVYAQYLNEKDGYGIDLSDPKDVKEIILNSATKHDNLKDKVVSSGTLNMLKALETLEKSKTLNIEISDFRPSMRRGVSFDFTLSRSNEDIDVNENYSISWFNKTDNVELSDKKSFNRAFYTSGKKELELKVTDNVTGIEFVKSFTINVLNLLKIKDVSFDNKKDFHVDNKFYYLYLSDDRSVRQVSVNSSEVDTTYNILLFDPVKKYIENTYRTYKLALNQDGFVYRLKKFNKDSQQNNIYVMGGIHQETDGFDKGYENFMDGNFIMLEYGTSYSDIIFSKDEKLLFALSDSKINYQRTSLNLANIYFDKYDTIEFSKSLGEDTTNKLNISSDGKYLIASGSKGVSIVDIPNKKEIAFIDDIDNVKSTQLSEDNKYLFISTSNQKGLVIYDTSDIENPIKKGEVKDLVEEDIIAFNIKDNMLLALTNRTLYGVDVSDIANLEVYVLFSFESDESAIAKILLNETKTRLAISSDQRAYIFSTDNMQKDRLQAQLDILKADREVLQSQKNELIYQESVSIHAQLPYQLAVNKKQKAVNSAQKEVNAAQKAVSEAQSLVDSLSRTVTSKLSTYTNKKLLHSRSITSYNNAVRRYNVKARLANKYRSKLLSYKRSLEYYRGKYQRARWGFVRNYYIRKYNGYVRKYNSARSKYYSYRYQASRLYGPVITKRSTKNKAANRKTKAQSDYNTAVTNLNNAEAKLGTANTNLSVQQGKLYNAQRELTNAQESYKDAKAATKKISDQIVPIDNKINELKKKINELE